MNRALLVACAEAAKEHSGIGSQGGCRRRRERRCQCRCLHQQSCERRRAGANRSHRYRPSQSHRSFRCSPDSRTPTPVRCPESCGMATAPPPTARRNVTLGRTCSENQIALAPTGTRRGSSKPPNFGSSSPAPTPPFPLSQRTREPRAAFAKKKPRGARTRPSPRPAQSKTSSMTSPMIMPPTRPPAMPSAMPPPSMPSR